MRLFFDCHKMRSITSATISNMKLSKAKTVDEFVAESAVQARPVLGQIREAVKKAVPGVEETMGYGKPFYKYHGWMTGITLYANHLGVEMWDGLSAEEREQLEALGYKTGSKTFQIKYDQAVPEKILIRLVKAQAKRNEAK